mgnify:CR=1 FL=1
MIAEEAGAILRELNSVLIGMEEETRLMMVALLANGHALLEGVPGVAKTTAVRGLARLLGLDGLEVELDGVPFRGVSRVQCTPDLMPSDVTGSLVYNPAELRFEPRFGPVFSYMLLVDEINRAIPRTQSALLQAMQEREVTIGDRTYRLEDRERGKFFFVLATQNPVEQEGTYPLPEAQLDRFLVRILVGYPRNLEEEKAVLRLHASRLTEPVLDLEPVVDPSWVVRAQEWVARSVGAAEETLEYVTRLVRYTRPESFEPAGELLVLGASPRAGIFLLRAAKAHAALRGAEEAEPEDVDAVSFAVLNHRLIPDPRRVVELRLSGAGLSSRYEIVRRAIELASRAAREAL